MPALNFPYPPTPGQLYPTPATSGVTQYIWDATAGVWNAVATFVKLNNQSAYNGYIWPNTDGASGQQLETDGAGNLYWDAAADPELFPLALLQGFNGVLTTFNIIDPATNNSYTPTPSSNLVVILGGVGQTPNSAYTVSADTISFTNPPASGTDIAIFTVTQP
jgi:hypothetical protein